MNLRCLLLLVVLLIASCTKEDTTSTTITTITSQKNTDVDVVLIVQNENNEPIENAEITLDGPQYNLQTNYEGILILDNLQLSEFGNLMAIQKEGYLTQYKLISGRSGSNLIIKITLLKVGTESQVLTGEKGPLDGGGSIVLPENLKSGDGSLFTGQVQVESKYVNPDEVNFLNEAPGNMLGESLDGSLSGLRSLGMYHVDLKDASGNLLQIPDGEMAQLEFPIPDVVSEFSLSEIPLWSFDETTGMWIEEGIASIENNHIRAKVSHFSWWNCDLPFDFVNGCIQVVDNEGEPMQYIDVQVGVGTSFFAHTTTDNEGYVCGKFPLGVRLILRVLDFAGDHLDYDFGIFDSSHQTIKIEVESFERITGTALTCDGQNVEVGLLKVQYESGEQMLSPFSNGDFEGYFFGDQVTIELLDYYNIKSVQKDIRRDQLNDGHIGNHVVCEDQSVQGVSGSVMIDSNGDLVGDIPLAGIEVVLLDQDVILPGGITDENGRYSFTTFPGEYEILIKPRDYKVSYAGDRSQDDETDAFKLSFENTIATNILEKEIDSDNDFLLLEPGLGTIRGSIRYDLDGDGVADQGAYGVPYFIGNTYLDPDGIVYGYTGENGNVDHENVEVSTGVFSIFNYYASFISSAQDDTPDPDGAFDSEDEYINQVRVKYVLEKDEIDADNNIVLHVEGQVISGNVLLDANEDEIGEVGLEFVPVELYRAGDLDPFRTAYTDKLGHYYFLGINPGQYSLRIAGLVDEYEFYNAEDLAPDDNPPNTTEDQSYLVIQLDSKDWDDGNTFIIRQK